MRPSGQKEERPREVAREGREGRRWDLMCLGGLLLLVLLYDVRLTFLRGLVITDDFQASDIANYHHPLKILLGQFLRTGKPLLWTPLIYNGFPVLGMGEVGIFYPLNWILFGLLPTGPAMDVLILLKFFLSGAFLYLYVRSLGISPLSALLGAIAFAWCGFMVAHVKHVNMTDAAMWIPLLLYTVERYALARTIRRALALSAVFGLQVLAANPQISYYTAGFILCYAAYRLFPSRREIRTALRPWGVLALGLLLGGGLGMIQILPTSELAGLSERGGGVGFQFAAGFSYSPSDLITFLSPYANGDPGAGTYTAQSIFWEDYGYLGILPLVFALAGIALGWRRPSSMSRGRSTVPFFTTTLLVSALMMLGDATPLFKLAYTLVPGMKLFRFPTRFILFVDLALSILACVGFQRVFSLVRRRWALPLQVLLLVLAAANLFYIQRRQNPVVDRSVWETPPRTAQILSRDKSLFRILSVGGMETHLMAYQRARGWEGDLRPYIEQREFLQPSLNVSYGLASADGLMNLAPRHLIRMWGNANALGILKRTWGFSADGKTLIVNPAAQEILKAFNVKYLLSPWEARDPTLTLLDRVRGVFLYENKAVLPRAFLVSQAVWADENETERLLLAGSVPLERCVLLSAGGPTRTEGEAAGNSGEVRILSYEPERVRLQVEARGRSWLVLSDTDYPGWIARVDGRPAKIYRANVCARALEMGPGTHEVTFSYRPRSLLVGGLLSLLSLLIWAGAMTASLRRARPA